MKKHRQSWATRKLPPPSVEEYERMLDFLANTMARVTKRDAELCLPMYRRLKKDRDALLDTASLLDDARSRLSRIGIENRL